MTPKTKTWRAEQKDMKFKLSFEFGVTTKTKDEVEKILQNIAEMITKKHQCDIYSITYTIMD